MAAAPIIDKHRLLAGHALLRELEPAELDLLASYARVVRHRAGDTIFLKGDPGTGLMAVIEGRVKISAPSPEGKDVILNVINDGEIFGEIALLDGKARTADAVAMSDCALLVLERRDFLPFLRSHPEICIRLLSVLCERLRRTSEQVEDILFLDLASRLARALLRLADRHGERVAGGLRIAMPLKQREFGEMLGLSRESVNKQLNEWRREGVIALSGGRVTIRDPAALRRLADPGASE